MRSTRGRSLRLRGQSLVEFALVVPLLLVLLFGFIQLSVWTFDSSTLAHAARQGTVRGNMATAQLNQKLASNSLLATPYNSLTAPSFSGQPLCLKQRNQVGSQNRLGWDWGCLYALDNGVPSAAGPLRAAIAGAQQAISNLWLGPRQRMEIRACYLVVASNSSTSCVYGLRSINGGAAAQYGSGVSNVTPAPSFIRVEIDVIAVQMATIPLLNFAPALTIRGAATEVFDRFLPACPAPQRTSDVTPGSCGALY